jgi:hypothetical protein
MIKLDIKVGDTILTGKWRNKKTVVKEIGKDELGQPTINGKPFLKCRIEKLMPAKKKVDESRKMNHLKLYEDFGQETRIKDPKVGEAANKYLEKILRKEMEFKLIDPRGEKFEEDFDDVEGSTQSELTWGFSDEQGKDSHISIEFTWAWEVKQGAWPEQTMDRFPEEREDISTLTDINLDSVYFHSDGGLDGYFDMNQENKKLLQDYLEDKLPVDKSKIFVIK